MPGDKVRVARLGESLVDVEMVKGKQLTVVYGGLRMKIKAAEVDEVVKAKPPSPPQAKPATRGAFCGGGGGGGGGKKKAAAASTGVAVRLDSNTLDLRGQYAGEIDGAIGRAVDRAASIGTLWVIHGHGTGALKKRVRELLREEPMVKRIEDAPQREGGAGCTIAYLK